MKKTYLEHQKSFEAYHLKHPEVLKELQRLIQMLRMKSVQHYANGALIEVMRWHFLMDRDEEYKINNNYRSFYTRLLIAADPSLKNFFEQRKFKSKEN
jgi:hypothetical protein